MREASVTLDPILTTDGLIAFQGSCTPSGHEDKGKDITSVANVSPPA